MLFNTRIRWALSLVTSVALLVSLFIVKNIATAQGASIPVGINNTRNTPSSTSAKVQIKGQPLVGGKLWIWMDSSLTGKMNFQWNRNNVKISGATSSTYTIKSLDLGKRLSVSVTSSRGATYLSASTLVLNTFKQVPKPQVSGDNRVGSTLTVAQGTWIPNPDGLKIQWSSGGRAIQGATQSTFKITMDQLGQPISVTVTASKSGYDSESATTTLSGAPLGPATLGTNQRLNSGQYLHSPNGQYKLIMQTDGNLNELNASGSSVFSTGTSGQNFLIMQDDGNLVMRRSDGTPIWDTATYGSGSNNYLYLQDDGNLVVKLANGTPQWARTTSWKGVVLPSGGTQAMSDATLSSTQNGTYAYNRTIWVVCYKYGQNVNGVGGWSSLWHQVIDGNFIADADYKTGVDGPMAGEPACSGSSVPGVNGWAYPILPHSTLTTYAGHNGDDFPVGVGTPVYSMGAGPVSFNSYAVTSNWCPVSSAIGQQQTDLKVTTVRDGYTYVVTYAHLNSFAVSSGQVVQAGQLIGYSGSKGCSSGPHLHIDMKRNGVANVIFPRNIFGTSY